MFISIIFVEQNSKCVQNAGCIFSNFLFPDYFQISFPMNCEIYITSYLLNVIDDV